MCRSRAVIVRGFARLEAICKRILGVDRQEFSFDFSSGLVRMEHGVKVCEGVD